MDKQPKDPRSTYLGDDEAPPLPEPATTPPTPRSSAVVGYFERARARMAERQVDDLDRIRPGMGDDTD